MFLFVFVSVESLLEHTAAVPEVLPGRTSCCIVGIVPPTIMADSFGDGLFSVFDDEQQTSTSNRKTPAPLTPDIGQVTLFYVK